MKILRLLAILTLLFYIFNKNAWAVYDPSSFWNNYSSATPLAISNNQIIEKTTPYTYTYRIYVKPREYGNQKWVFWFSNNVDNDPKGSGINGPGSVGNTAMTNDLGGTWKIESAYVADGKTAPDGSIEVNTQIALTYGSSYFKQVTPGEKFWSDPVNFNLPTGHFLAFTWSISTTATGKTLPFSYQKQYPSYYQNNNFASQESNYGFIQNTTWAVAPNLIAYEKAQTKKLCFLGDSITAGMSTTMNSYQDFVSKITESLGTNYSVWNLGSPWGEAFDATTDGSWLYKAKQCEEVFIMLGVNDMISNRPNSQNQILGDLTNIVNKLKTNNPNMSIILSTIPPFNFNNNIDIYRRGVNNSIKNQQIVGVDRIFDAAKILSQDSPNENLIKINFFTGTDNHPNNEGHLALATEFLSFYFPKGDLNKDTHVNIFDLRHFLSNFLQSFTIFDYNKIVENFGI